MGNIEPVKGNMKNKLWFIFIIVYLLIDYGRIHAILSLEFMRPAMVVIIILAGFILAKGGLSLAWNRQMKMVWLFILLLAAYIPFAVNTFYAYHTARAMLLYMPFIISVIVCIDNMDRLRKIVLICVCIMIFISVYAITHKGMGPGNYFLDENDLSLYVNMWLPFCYFLFFTEKEKFKKVIYGIGMVLGLGAVVISFSRGGFVGLVAMLAVVWFVSPRKILSLAVVSVIVIGMLAFGSDEYWAEMSTVTDMSESTADQRLDSWRAGWSMFLSHPLGVGGNNFPVWFPEYQPPGMSRGMWGRVAHSIWFTLIPETGVVGIWLYFTLLFYNIRELFFLKNLVNQRGDEDARYLHGFALACLASLAGYFASGTFLSVLYYPHYWYLTAFIVAAVMISQKMMANDRDQSGIMLQDKT